MNRSHSLKVQSASLWILQWGLILTVEASSWRSYVGPVGIWHWLPETSLEKTLRGTATQKGCTEKVSWIDVFITCQPKLAVFDQCTSCLRMCFVVRGWNGDVPSCHLRDASPCISTHTDTNQTKHEHSHAIRKQASRDFLHTCML